MTILFCSKFNLLSFIYGHGIYQVLFDCGLLKESCPKVQVAEKEPVTNGIKWQEINIKMHEYFANIELSFHYETKKTLKLHT